MGRVTSPVLKPITPTPGETITVCWGRFGLVNTLVTRIGERGVVYVKRWDKSNRAWTEERRIALESGRYIVVGNH